MDLVSICEGHSLAAAPAASFLRAVDAGCPVAIASSFRDRVEQQRLRALYLAGKFDAYVAPVEKSEHVVGNALDLKDPAIEWMRAHPEYGWTYTDPTERWHAAYRLVLDHSAAAPRPPAPIEEDDMIAIARLKDQYRDGRVWVGNGIQRTHVTNPAALADLQSQIRNGFFRAKTAEVQVVDSLEWLGKVV
ncbi:hypothetical protein [Cellulomonas hominis]|uniref:hypothetical protein n=1 Tax=Cellulomonas hominis TaxID=156981 RepID=UPI001B937B26|nr:hypothetical protein [Cellulomonas hominis]VTR75860.1 hypothetical protein CHMI_00613 [Cellulomonas hominis]